MPAIGYNLAIPVTIQPLDGPFGMVKTFNENARQSMKMVILTSPGERIGFPEFGVGLRKYLFENLNSSTLVTLKNEILRQVTRYVNYINLVNVSVTQDKINEVNYDPYVSRGDYSVSPYKINVSITYSVPGLPGNIENFYLEIW